MRQAEWLNLLLCLLDGIHRNERYGLLYIRLCIAKLHDRKKKRKAEYQLINIALAHDI